MTDKNAERIASWLEDYGSDAAAEDIRALAACADALAAERDALRNALDPNMTKAAYMGEVCDDVVALQWDEGEGEYIEAVQRRPVSWTAIKAIMAMISARAAPSTGEKP